MAACATMSAVNFELDLGFLTVEERQTILAVLQRDEELRQAEQERKRALKNEIAQLRQQSAIRVGAQQKSRQCSRCHKELGLLFKKGEVCMKCKHQICMNCRVSIGESAAYSWLCTLCYKQRLLPAVAGDWFYSKIEERHKFDMQALHGSDVVRSSIRRLSAPNMSGRSRNNSAAEMRNNPFTNSSVPVEQPVSAASTTGRRVSDRSNGEAGVEPDTFVHHRVVRTVRSKGLRDSSDSSDSSSSSSDSEVHTDRENSLKERVFTELLQSSSDSEGNAATRLVPILSAGDEETSLDKSAQMSRSAEEFESPPTDSQDPASLSIDANRIRSKSAVETNHRLEADYKIEEITQVEFRKCSVGDTTKLDEEDPQKANCGFGSGGGLNRGSGGVVGVIASSNILSTNKTPLEYTQSNSFESTTSEDSLRRKLPLTPDLDRKSPMIGRRELDISKKFLKSFSDDSSSEGDTLDEEEMFDTEEMNRYSVEMPKVERATLQSKLSVIREEDTPSNSPATETKEKKKLKLIIDPKDFESPVSAKTDGSPHETPVTPGKYSTNWDDLTVTPRQDKLSKTTSWSSGNQSADIENLKAEPSLHPGVSTSDNFSSPLVSGGFDVLGLAVTDPSVSEQQSSTTVQRSVPTPAASASLPLSDEKTVKAALDVSSHNSGDEMAKRKMSDTPQMPFSSPPQIDVSMAEYDDDVCHSLPDEFDEEDIDNIVAEAKQARKSSKLSSHLTVSMESITSAFSEAGADYSKHEISGDMQFSLSYEKKTGVLTLTVHRCRDLVAVHKKKKDSDPYVKAYLVSGNQKFNKRKTKVKKSTVNPVYEETFRYTLSSSDLYSKTLQLSVWSYNRISQGDFMGEVNIPLNSYPFDKNSGHPEWYPLGNKMVKAPDAAPENPPELRVSLRYVPIPPIKTKGAKAELTIKFLCARHLPTKKSGISDPFVKCVMMPDKVKQKTAVVRNNLNPVWDETFTFTKSSNEALEESSLDISVIDHDRFSSNDLIGTVKLNLGRGTSFGKKVDWMSASGPAKQLWESVINNPGEWVNQWLPLNIP